MTIKEACEEAVKTGRNAIILTDNMGYEDLRVHVDKSGPLYFINPEYIDTNGHPPYWNPTFEELTATNWVVCD